MTLNLLENTAVPALTQWQPQDWPSESDWQPTLQHFLASSTGKALAGFVRQRLAAGAVVYPPQPFCALQLTSLAATRVVILGQDPYHGAGQAEGLAFSVPRGVKIPPSLRNIFKELQRDLGLAPPMQGSLSHWAKQGVLLLNTSLTVEADAAGSHAKKGWEQLTDALIAAVAQKSSGVAFLLWGAHAQAKRALIEGSQSPNQTAGGQVVLSAKHPAYNPPKRHLVLCANHPSPLAALRPPAPFIGCGHFSQVNAFLQQNGQAPVQWAAS